MIRNLKLVKIDSKYCDYLRQFDKKVPYNAGKKELRPFIGILFTVNNFEYFAPLSSPKPKHKSMKNNIDIIKIDSGNLGVVNFNNMIPVNEDNYVVYNFNNNVENTYDIKWQYLLKTQLLWLNKNIDKVKSKSERIYKRYVEDKLPKNIKDRCCNFLLLEEKSKEWKKLYNKV